MMNARMSTSGLAPRKPIKQQQSPYPQLAEPTPLPSYVDYTPTQQAMPPSINSRKPMSMMQQAAAPAINSRKPMTVNVAQPAPAPSINPRKPIIHTQNRVSHGLSVRKPIDATNTPSPSLDVSMLTNCIQPSIKPRRVMQQPQQQQQQQQQQQWGGSTQQPYLMYNPYQQIQQQQQQQPFFGNAVPFVPAVVTMMPGAVLSVEGDASGVDPKELAMLQGLLEQDLLSPAQFSERMNFLVDQTVVPPPKHELTLDDFPTHPSASDEAVYAADGDALHIADFVSSFLFDGQPTLTELLPSSNSSSGKNIDDIFVSSSYEYEFLGAPAKGESSGSVTRSTRTKVHLAQNRNIRVFVSSTFRDMKEERDELMKFAFPQLRKFCTDRGVTLTMVDLRWGITDEQSKAGDTINICLSEVDRCRPYFLCMLGERYGWAHADDSFSDELLSRTFDRARGTYPWLANMKNRSITELEIRHAVLNDASARVLEHSMFYLRDPSYMPAGPQDAVYTDRMEALKREIRLSGAAVVQDYKMPKDMAVYVLEAMKKMIDKDFPLSEQPGPLERERALHDAFAATRASVYIGRQYYFDEIMKHLSNTNSKPMVIVGESGSGKSALTCNWTLQYKSAQTHKLVVAHYIGCTAASTDLASMLRRIIEEIREYYKIDKDVPRDLPALIEGFPEFLSEAAQRGGMVLVLDALNQLEDKGDVHDLHWLPREFPNGIQLVLSTLPGRCLNMVANQRGWTTLKVEPLTAPERVTLVEEYLVQYGKTLTKKQLDTIVQAPQSQNPLFLRTLMEELRVFGTFEELDSKIQYYLRASNPPELFNLVFERLETDFTPKHLSLGPAGLVGNIMGLLWASRRGLSETEVLDILGVAHADWAPLHIALDEYLISRSGVLTFFHDYMRQAVEARYIKGGRFENDYRRKLIAYFRGDTSKGKEIPQNRFLEEVPYQLLRSQNFAGLEEFITDLSTFSKLYIEEHKYDLYRYWQEAAKRNSKIEARLLSNLEDLGKLIPEDESEALGDLINSVAKFLQDIASYESAEKLFEAALELAKKSHKDNPDHPEIAQKLDALAYMYRMAGKYAKAAPLYERAMDIRERILGPDNAEFASSVNSLAILYRHQGKYEKAEPLYNKALSIREKLFGHIHHDVAQSLNSLGCLTQDMGRYKESEDYFVRAVSMRETLCGPNHPDVAMSLNNMAGLFMDQSKYEQARPIYNRALEIYESIYGPIHPTVATTMNSLAGLAQEEGKYEEAAKVYQRTLAIKEKLLGPMHPELALTLNDYAVMFARQDRYSEAQPLYERALSIREAVLGKTHPDYAQSLNNLGSLHQDTRNYARAQQLFEEALRICEAAFGRTHMDVANCLTNIGGVYQFTNRHREAVPLYNRALDIYKQLLGPNHADVAVTLNDLAVLHYHIGDYTQAESLYTRALQTYETVFGRSHPDVAQALGNLGEFYRSQQRMTEALPALQRCVEICTAVFGASHSRTASALAALHACQEQQ
eukprot:TRINITY_DN181_c2_g1_i1.p1 TRINITY_DN181_c2_g1~~TRINITY_DN181_c2_g1_i1.p1  ORF type:complete len:1492 (-),score=334.59 TRINITY_DN181_c2_g1_i1:1835-6310(-)